MVKKTQLVGDKPVGCFTNRSLIDHQAHLWKLGQRGN